MDKMNIVMTVIFIFTFVPLVIAEVARKRSENTATDFFLYNRNMPMLLAFATIYATWVSSFAVLGATGMFYEKGPVYMTCFAWNILFGLLYMLIGERIWFIGIKNNLSTPSDFFYYIFNHRGLSILVTVVMIGFTIPYIMIQLFGGALIIEAMSHGLIPWRMAGFIFYMVIVIYLWSGGLRAVAMTDIFYGILTFITMILMGMVLIDKVGGAEPAFMKATDIDSEFVTFSEGNNKTSITLWLSMFIIVPLGALMGPAMWVRMYAVGERKTFRIMPLLLGVVTVMYVGTILSSVSAKVLMPDVMADDKLIPNLLVENIGLILASILMCGITSASLSTANSQIHALSGVLTFDVYKKIVSKSNRDLSEHRLLSVGKWSVIFVSALAYIIMIYGPMHIIEIGMIAMGGVAQIFVPTVGILVWRKANGKAAFYGLAVGEIIVCIALVVSRENMVYVAVIALFVNALIFLILSGILSKDELSYNKISFYKNEFRNYIRRN